MPGVSEGMAELSHKVIQYVDHKVLIELIACSIEIPCIIFNILWFKIKLINGIVLVRGCLSIN